MPLKVLILYRELHSYIMLTLSIVNDVVLRKPEILKEVILILLIVKIS